RSPAAEQYRLLAARLEGVRARHELRSVAVTSTMPDEGKTMTSVNLAYVLAKDFGRRVLLIDGDLKKPSVWRYVGSSPRAGLCELIANRQPLEAVVHTFRHEQLEVLEAGLLPLNPVRVWKSALIKELFAQLTRRYDYVIVDTPPVLTVVDATLIADLVDGVAVVVRSEMTPKAALQKSIGSLPRAKIVGLVFNGVRVSRSPYYFRYP
ncbi:MAG: CpsD/CapB family tyrosine-protein kinase, partial [Nitrospiria bacterium]